MAPKISVIIPNYNGKDLLARNLPKVLETCSGCEIIVVDDGSSDNSDEFVSHNFKTVKIISLKKNLGFANAINLGVAKAQGSLILLLNSDVSPQKGFLKYAVRHFQKDKNLFAVGMLDRSHEKRGIIERGRGGGVFERGFLRHFALPPNSAETLWVSGGSGLFDKEKFLKLGGFDEVYSPFYWEDIDLSFRAQKNGFNCAFEPKAKVDHFHEEGTIKSYYSKNFVKTISYRNQIIFVWKNINSVKLLILHLLWLPYHLLRAVFSADFAFVLGFLWALAKIPNLVLNHKNFSYVYSDWDIVKKYGKP